VRISLSRGSVLSREYFPSSDCCGCSRQCYRVSLLLLVLSFAFETGNLFTSSKLDVVCSVFAAACEMCIACAKVAKNLGLRLGLVVTAAYRLESDDALIGNTLH